MPNVGLHIGYVLVNVHEDRDDRNRIVVTVSSDMGTEAGSILALALEQTTRKFEHGEQEES